ncbi:MAG: hypothetical protein IPK19_22650 [Chloroflexi bacterium]|nr:hypothetical protein [Chloroflexota bacterium]
MVFAVLLPHAVLEQANPLEPRLEIEGAARRFLDGRLDTALRLVVLQTELVEDFLLQCAHGPIPPSISYPTSSPRGG